ncbi:MAG TPA: ATPase domain-containing protein [Thermoanaerobaculia bacterium]|jgi:circadian clock protein KaiC
MSEKTATGLRKLTSGIEKLDLVLGGGIPEFSFNLIMGEPGSGKTTLAHQIVFANATPDRPALYFTVLGEPTIKMLRYQQQFTFFDAAKVNESIHFVNLGELALGGDLTKTLEAIMNEMERVQPAIVVVDSFRSLVAPSTQGSVQEFVQKLAVRLTGWQATTFLVGEYAEGEHEKSPVFTIADGTIALSQNVVRNSMVRKLRVHKLRGGNPQPGMHTVRITGDGLEVFPRMIKPVEESQVVVSKKLISTGVARLDEMLGGGTFEGSSLIVAGPAGAGKTTISLHFIAEGVKQGEPGVIALFEETVPKYVLQAKGFGIDLQKMIDAGQVEVVYIRPLDLSVDETLYAVQAAVERIGACRVVIDSLSAMENALAPTFKEDYAESLYRLIGALTGNGVSIMMTVEITTSYEELQFTPHAISFLTHDIIMLRYFEVDGQLKTFLTVIKTRGRKHSADISSYEITNEGIVIGRVLDDLHGLITAVPQRKRDSRYHGLTSEEAEVLNVIVGFGDSTEKRLREATRLSAGALTAALNRLTTLGYAKKALKRGHRVYRAALEKE